MDNVTIKSAGDLTVHGVESDGYTDSDKKLNGGKISLTSTGDKGKITLGAGVDYDGNATAGTLAAASTEKGAVIVDAQGSQGSLVNNTTGTDAVTTGTDVTTNTKGTWQVYVNSPSDYGTSLGDNLVSGTNAQWTAKSTANSTVTTNSSSNTLAPYTDTSSNKFIFQVTPVITISGGYASKTYGNTLSEEAMAMTLTSKAVYKDSTQKNIDVTSFKNFDESGYLTYVTSSDGTKTGLSTVSVSSDGAKETATRTKGNEKVKGTDGKETNEYKKADDDNRAFYVMDVTYQDGVKTLNGYDKAANDGEVEIKRKTLTIKTNATQTYGDSTITLGTPSDYESQLVGKDKLNANDITYSISTTGDYAKSKGTNPTAHTAHVREGGYSDEYLTTGAAIKDGDGNDASANYEVTGSGTIKVNPADLYLTVGNVSTTYGTAFKTNDYKYAIDTTKSAGLVNGDTKTSLGVDDSFLKYTNTGDAADPDKIAKGAITQNAGDYELKGTANKTLTDYIVHITNGKSVVNPKDINIYAEGNGSTLSDVTWTKIEKDKLVNGDSWGNGFTFSVEPGDIISYADKTFGIKGYVNGQPVSDGTQIGNYIYHPTGIVQLTFNPIVKPDVWAYSGGYRPRNKIETSLPVFRVEDAKVGQYGTYGVEHREGEDKLVLSATGMRLPEPDQVPDEERTFTTTLSTEEGSGTFKLEYNGVSLKVHPQDKKAEEVVRAGDKTKNVSLSEKALYVGYTEMGLDLIDLKGVYIYFN